MGAVLAETRARAATMDKAALVARLMAAVAARRTARTMKGRKFAADLARIYEGALLTRPS